MNFFGVGLFEILLVLLLGLVVLGPERLQDMGRQAGKLVARWLAFQQQSPELQMVKQMRQEFEQEIVSLRDELVRARQQLDVSAELKQLRHDMDDTAKAMDASLKHPGTTEATETTGATPDAPPAADASPGAPEPVPAPAAEQPPASDSGTAPPAAPQPVPPAEQIVPREKSAPAAASSNGKSSVARRTPAASSAEHDLLLLEMHALIADFHALQEHLRQRGMLEDEWQPPSAALAGDLESSLSAEPHLPRNGTRQPTGADPNIEAPV